MHALIGQKPMFYQSINIEKACFIVIFAPVKSISQSKLKQSYFVGCQSMYVHGKSDLLYIFNK